MIGDCNFTYNYATSLVYIGNNDIIFSHNTFCHNQGVSVYAVNLNIYLKGMNLFQNNTAKLVAGIYIRDSEIILLLYAVKIHVQHLLKLKMLVLVEQFLNNYSNLM